MTVEKSYQLVIGNERMPAASGETFGTRNPATGNELTSVPAGRAEDVDKAVESGREGFHTWADIDPVERSRLLQSLSDEILANKDRLAELETLDCGKPISEARGDVESCARYFEFYAGIADKLRGESIPISNDYVDFTVNEPLGVTGLIIPWNFPISMVGRSAGPALAAGNAVVVKPAEQTPLTALEIGELAAEVGFPQGVLNVVTGFGDTAGQALSSHSDIDGISFTGSVPTGTKVAEAAAKSIVPVHLELGGKSPIVVYPDANLDMAVENAITGIFTSNAGQVCNAASRALVHEDIHDRFTSELVSRVEEISIGDGMTDPDMGPLVSRGQLERVESYIETGKTEHGDPITGGSVLEREGHFVEPTVFDGVDNDMTIAQEEIFGPVLTVDTFEDETEAIAIANDVEYGLVAGVFTENISRAYRFARKVDAGQIYINEWFAGGVEAPFGGYKKSGYGRERGLEAVEEYMQIKNVCAKIDR